MTESQLPKMSYARKAVIASHPHNRFRATSHFVLSTAQICHDMNRMLTLLDDPFMIVDGPEHEEALRYMFARVNAAFFDAFGQEIPDGN